MARTVRVFQSGIDELADDPGDAIADTMERLADEIAERALENARVIIPSLPADFLTVEFGKDSKGLFFRVVASTVGRLGRYLTQKEAREHVWFEPAVAEVIGPENLRTPIS